MSQETQEIQYDNLRVHEPAAEKLREVVRAYKQARGVSPTHSEALTIIADHYLGLLAHESRTQANPIPS